MRIEWLTASRLRAGDGFGLDQVRPSIQLAHDIRHAEAVTPGADQAHPPCWSEAMCRERVLEIDLPEW